MQKVLLCGGAGYIGSHTAIALAQAGFECVVIDDLSTGNIENVRNSVFYKMDLRNFNSLKEIFSKFRFSAVFLFAASASVAESEEKPLEYFDNNVVSTINVLNCLREFKNIPLIFSSSCSTYGSTKLDQITENHDQKPINTYGNTKFICEQIIEKNGNASEQRHVILRYFNVAGADVKNRLGENHFPERHLIPNLISASKEKAKFTIFGSDYETRDGTAVRDYVHVTDLANAHLSALKFILDGGKNSVFNVGTGLGNSILDIVYDLRNLGHALDYEFRDRRIGDPATLVADISRITSELNWRPRRSEMSEILLSYLRLY